jgi:hypothetical protein
MIDLRLQNKVSLVTFVKGRKMTMNSQLFLDHSLEIQGLKNVELSELLSGQFRQLTIFDDFSALPFLLAEQCMQMIHRALTFTSDKHRTDETVCERLSETELNENVWIVRYFPKFGHAVLVTLHLPFDETIIIDFAFPNIEFGRKKTSYFDDLCRPSLISEKVQDSQIDCQNGFFEKWVS